MSTLTFKIQQVEALPVQVTATYFYSRTVTITNSLNNTDPTNSTFHISGKVNTTFSYEQIGNDIINITMPKEDAYPETEYDPVANITRVITMTSDGYGKIYKDANISDVDVISMTNDTGTFFKNWSDGTWHQSGEEWLGDGELDPAGSGWLCFTYNVSIYQGNGTDILLGVRSFETWRTTGYSENTIIEPASRLNCSFMSGTGTPFAYPYTATAAELVETTGKLNDTLAGCRFDSQHKVIAGSVNSSAFVSTMLSPANLFITDPENNHIGINPYTGELVNEIPGALCTEPGPEPQIIIIPYPSDGVYSIIIDGTDTGSYISIYELAMPEYATTTHTYTGDISPDDILQSQVNISEDTMTSTEPAPVSSVGGISIPVNKIGLLAPYIALVSTIVVATVATIYVKRKKKHS